MKDLPLGTCGSLGGPWGSPWGVMRQEKVVENIMKYTTSNSKLMVRFVVGFCSISWGSLGPPGRPLGVPGPMHSKYTFDML